MASATFRKTLTALNATKVMARPCSLRRENGIIDHTSNSTIKATRDMYSV